MADEPPKPAEFKTAPPPWSMYRRDAKDVPPPTTGTPGTEIPVGSNSLVEADGTFVMSTGVAFQFPPAETSVTGRYVVYNSWPDHAAMQWDPNAKVWNWLPGFPEALKAGPEVWTKNPKYKGG